MKSAVIVGAEAGDLRRRVGPSAWCALEVLAASSISGHRDGAWAAMTVRSVATELGLSKNAANRALRALRRAGLVVSTQRRGDAGRFDGGGYWLMVPSEIVCVVDIGRVQRGSLASAAPSKPRASQSPQVEQLVLLPSE